MDDKSRVTSMSSVINAELRLPKQEANTSLNEELVEQPLGSSSIFKQSRVLNLFEDGRKTWRLLRLSQMISRGLMSLAFLSLALSLIAKESEISHLESVSKILEVPPSAREEFAKKHKPRDGESLPLLSAYTNLIVSGVMVCINFLQMRTDHRLRQLRLELSPIAPFWNWANIKALLMQSFVIMVGPVPWLIGQKVRVRNTYIGKEVDFYLNDYLHLFQFSKIYFIIQEFFNGSGFSSNRCYRVCSMFSVENNSTMIIRCMMKKNPLRFSLLVYLFGIMIFGYALRIAEAPLIIVEKSVPLANYFDCCWTAMATMTTVGYGDFYPRTTPGRLLMFCCCIYGVCVLSLIVNVVSQELTLSNGELKAYTIIIRMQIKEELRVNSAALLKKMGQMFIFKSKNKPSIEREATVKKHRENLFNKFKDVKTLHDQYKQTVDDNSEEDLERNFSLITNEMRELKEIMYTLQNAVSKFNEQKNSREGPSPVEEPAPKIEKRERTPSDHKSSSSSKSDASND